MINKYTTVAMIRKRKRQLWNILENYHHVYILLLLADNQSSHIFSLATLRKNMYHIIQFPVPIVFLYRKFTVFSFFNSNFRYHSGR